MAIKTVLKNMARKMSLSEVHAAAQKSIITEAVGESFYNEFGDGTTFPQVVLDGKKLGGCVDSIRYLQEKAIL